MLWMGRDWIGRIGAAIFLFVLGRSRPLRAGNRRCCLIASAFAGRLWRRDQLNKLIDFWIMSFTALMATTLAW